MCAAVVLLMRAAESRAGPVPVISWQRTFAAVKKIGAGPAPPCRVGYRTLNSPICLALTRIGSIRTLASISSSVLEKHASL